MKNKLIKLLGGFTRGELHELDRLAKAYSTKEYKRGLNDGYQKGKARLQKTPGYFRDQIHKKLNFIFGGSKEGKNAQYRWLKKHTMTTSHMSEMEMAELKQLNTLLDSMMKGDNERK